MASCKPMMSLDEIAERIETALPGDRGGFRGRLRSMRQAAKAGKPFDRNQTRLQRDLERSIEQFALRRQAVPPVTFGNDLPIHERIDEIKTAIQDNPVVIICGETGSGKSTQLPKICLAMGRGVGGMIGHTQPRRIAARSVAARVAEELKVSSDLVGFKIRFTDTTSPRTYVKLMTDGILLAETQGDRLLSAYDTIIVDEAHERSLNIDLLLGYLKQLLPKRPDLRVIVTSATIDVERYSEFFATAAGPAPILLVEGRSYPVELRYRPPEATVEGEREPDPLQNLLGAVEEVCREGSGDSLIFVPTERDIREVAHVLRSRTLPGDHAGFTSEILPLYGRLSAAEQSRVFQPHPHRRIIIATNVAESSITVPNIRYVIDTGTARISRYSARSGVQRLPIEPVSRASADQRKGRCGRIGPGVCIRLYSEEDFEGRDEYTPPEIQRTNLAAVILQLKTLGLGDIENFPLLDPPKPGTIRDGYDTLFELGAIDEQRELTEKGRALAKLPVDPRVGRMILAAQDEGCLREILIIASALELQDPRERPLEHQQAADQAHRPFVSTESDFLSFLKLWQFIKQQQRELSRSKFRRMCQKKFLSYHRVREWQDIHRQLVQLTEQAGLDPHRGFDALTRWDLTEPKPSEPVESPESAPRRHPHDKRPRDDRKAPREAFDGLHRALMAGLLSNIAMKKDDKNEYTGSGGQTLFIWPGSGLIEQKPKWLVAAELVETTRRYARCVARVHPGSIESLAAHLIKRQYGEPRWEAGSGRVIADERVTLFGLPIVPRRMANYGPIDPAVARTLWIQHGLVEGDWDNPPAFLRENRKLIEEVEELLTKTRRVDLLQGEAALFRFYDERLPAELYDGPTLSRWLKRAGGDAIDRLRLRKSDLVRDEAASIAEADFPGDIQAGGVQLPLEYHLEPGADDDGVTIIVPQVALGQLPPARLGWLVPGLLEEKIAALIRSLPKLVRTAFVPVPQTARELVSGMTFGQGELESVLAERLSKMAGDRITREMFDIERLPKHLRMNVRVVDEEGAAIATSRNVSELQQRYGVSGAVAFRDQAGTDQWQREGLTDWTWGALPEAIELQRGGMTFQAYPAVIDQRDAVGLRLFDSLDEANEQTRRGLRRLFLLGNAKAIRTQVDWLPELDRHLLNLSTLRSPGEMRTQLVELIADRALWGQDATIPRDEGAYRRFLKLGRSRIRIAAQEVNELLGPLAAGWQAVKLFLEQRHPPVWEAVVADVRSQVEQLFGPQFLTTTPWPWLTHIPRYLDAIQQRVEKLSGGGLDRDRRLREQIAPHWQIYSRKVAELDGRRPTGALTQFHFMIEEYRVSLFAQKLGTSITVSEKRLEKAAAKLK